MTTNDNNNKNNTLPEYIQGIPTAKNKSRERMDLIRKYYSFLWKKLQKEKGKYIIFNDYLGVDVYIIEKESDKKTINAASRNWQSTYAVKHLNDVVRFANCDDNTTIFFKPKEGTQTENRYKNIAVLYYDFINKNVDYLNFKVKLTIGIRSDNKHIQYCVNKIEVKEKKPTVQSVTN
ncbi:MAG: hypothetical protein J6W12_01960 [Bacteroidales bacterium]|nr:hypothetical protein [Bacteroidales bacterium]